MTEKQKKRFYPVIEKEQCKGCGRCVEACPKMVLEMKTDLNQMGYPHAVYLGEGCVGCGACFYNCPEPGAVAVIEESDED
jgi:NAD-dependent dihydropyrimidine dehydrogenase PreA subunit